MEKSKEIMLKMQHLVPRILQWFLNICLIILALFLAILMVKELIVFFEILFSHHKTTHEHEVFFANILIFFLYFEFITMIVKYFKEDYHFPLRYFIYIGITAMIRLVIIDHSDAKSMLLYAFVILLLIISYFIINITPLERPMKIFYKRKTKIE
ncbi:MULTISPECIES: phosphate-starvation-inducible protein PsiE [unclassified Rummeliibacillus]|uniref:phosphate-starvation-inducible protein PsiE n=1 Tax=unclassified Rummeliibacillus TaxID=2622809 RepID=UPI000E66225A|nr:MULTISPECIES: phosphate-starvation-inducible protein PsiE [unclassified Rummeliibacillus]RIJ63544.1 phosphate-starvation-inducible protein PsiE [Rummeliibacillus sp. POC4]RPJ94481.1 phosphate-starvation-inducible protein PsiE [Rummeliibacillus sp. TYF005]